MASSALLERSDASSTIDCITVPGSDDSRISTLPPGLPFSWHSQRSDALVSTPHGLVYYGRSDSTETLICATSSWARVNLHALGSTPLGLSSYGDLVFTLSNPCVMLDLSAHEQASVVPILYLDGSPMVNALRVMRLNARRNAVRGSAPMDLFLVIFCTNEGVLASKVFMYTPLMRYLTRFRVHRARSLPAPAQPQAQLLVWKTFDTAVNDFSVRLRPFEPGYADVVTCHDAYYLCIAQVAFSCSGTGTVTVRWLPKQTIRLDGPQRGVSAPSDSDGSNDENDTVEANTTIPTTAGAAAAGVQADDEMPLELMTMMGFFTYVAFNKDATTIVATADADRLVVVFQKNNPISLPPPQPHGGDAGGGIPDVGGDGVVNRRLWVVTHVYRIHDENEKPYKVISLSKHVFVVAAKLSIIVIDLAAKRSSCGSATSSAQRRELDREDEKKNFYVYRFPDDREGGGRIICGLDGYGEGSFYVALSRHDVAGNLPSWCFTPSENLFRFHIARRRGAIASCSNSTAVMDNKLVSVAVYSRGGGTHRTWRPPTEFPVPSSITLYPKEDEYALSPLVTAGSSSGDDVWSLKAFCTDWIRHALDHNAQGSQTPSSSSSLSNSQGPPHTGFSNGGGAPTTTLVGMPSQETSGILASVMQPTTAGSGDQGWLSREECNTFFAVGLHRCRLNHVMDTVLPCGLDDSGECDDTHAEDAPLTQRSDTTPPSPRGDVLLSCGSCPRMLHRHNGALVCHTCGEVVCRRCVVEKVKSLCSVD